MKDTSDQRRFWISPEVHALGISFAVAEIRGVTVQARSKELEKSKHARELATNLGERQNRLLASYRRLIAAVGVEGVEASPEALIGIVRRSGRLPAINTVVDCYNEQSIERCLVVSAHDLAAISGDICLRTTTGGEPFRPLGQTEVELLRAGEWVGMDENHVLCRLNIKQSELSKVTTATRDLLVYLQGNPEIDQASLEHELTGVCEQVIRFNGGSQRGLEQRLEPTAAQRAPESLN